MGLLPAHRLNCKIHSTSSIRISRPFLPSSPRRSSNPEPDWGDFLANAVPVEKLAPLCTVRYLAPSVPLTSSNPLPALPRDVQGPPEITGMGNSSWRGEENKSTQVLLPLVRLSLAIPFHLFSWLYPTPLSPPLSPGSLLTDFVEYWWKLVPISGSGQWCSLFQDLSQCQGSGPSSRCWRLNLPERKYYRAGEGEDTSS